MQHGKLSSSQLAAEYASSKEGSGEYAPPNKPSGEGASSFVPTSMLDRYPAPADMACRRNGVSLCSLSPLTSVDDLPCCTAVANCFSLVNRVRGLQIKSCDKDKKKNRWYKMITRRLPDNNNDHAVFADNKGHQKIWGGSILENRGIRDTFGEKGDTRVLQTP